MKMTLIAILLLLSSLSRAQTACNTTPTQCYEMEQRKRTEAIRMKQEREAATYRQQQLEMQQAQLKEMQEQRAILEETNAIQQRMEDVRMEKTKNVQQ